VSAIAASSTSSYAHAHAAVTAASGAALDHGFQTALYALTGVLLLGAVIAAALVRSAPVSQREAELVGPEVVALEEAA
jgi:hypothetical protein